MYKEIKSFIIQELIYIDNPESLTADTNLLQAGLDSMGVMRLIMFIEQTFNVTLPDVEVEPNNIQTLDCIVRWVKRHQL